MKIKNNKIKIHCGYELSLRPFMGFHVWWSDNQHDYQFFAIGNVGWLNYLWHKGYITRRIKVKKEFKRLF